MPIRESIVTFTSITSTPDQRTHALNDILLKLNTSPSTLLDIISHLGPELTSTQDETRTRGTLLLSEILTRLTGLILNEAQKHTIITFFIQRVEDTPCLKEVLMAFYAIVQHHTLTPEQVKTVTNKLLTLTIQSLPQSSRKYFFDIMHVMIRRYPDNVIALGTHFINDYITAMDGEKDPRNLITCFALVTFITTHFSPDIVKTHIEQLFEITSCYFPITFTAPKNDPYGITGTDLVQGLRNVLSSTPLMVEYVIPLLLEKMEATGNEVKLDAIDTMNACVAAYGPSPVAPFLPTVYDALKKEILAPSPPAVATSASNCLITIVSLICPDTIAGFVASHLVSHWDSFMEPLVAECVLEMNVPDTKLARAHSQMLVLAMSSTSNALRRIMERIWPAIYDRFYSMHVQPSQRLALLEFIYSIVKVATKPLHPSITIHPFQSYLDPMIEMLSSSLMGGNAEIRGTAVSALCTLATLPAPSSTSTSTSTSPSAPASLVSSTQTSTIVQQITQLLFTDEDQRVRGPALDGLVSIAQFYVTPILSHTIPQLFDIPQFQTSPSSTSTSTSTSSSTTAPFKDLGSVLTAVAALSIAPAVFQATLPHLLKLVQTQFNAALAGETDSLRTIYSVLACISAIVTRHTSTPQGQYDLQSIMSILPSSLIATLVHGSLVLSQYSQEHALDSKVVHACTTILTAMARVADQQSQSSLLTGIINLYLDGDLSSYTSSNLASHLTGTHTSTFTPLTTTSKPSLAQLQLLPLFTAVVGSIRQDVVIPRQDQVISKIMMFLSLPEGERPVESTLAVLQALAAIVNKLPVDQVNSFVATVIEGRWLVTIRNDAAPLPQRIRAANNFVWLLKALVMRSHPTSTDLGIALCDMLLLQQAPEMAHIAARGFDTILADCPVVLNREAHAICGVGVLYKQRFFTIHLPHLLSRFQAIRMDGVPPTSPLHTTRIELLTAVANLTKHLPISVILGHLHTLLPLMLQSLSSPNAELRIATLASVTKLVRINVTSLSDHISTLIPILMELTHYHSSMMVRLSALQCLESFLILPYHKLYPYKIHVMNGLTSVLDDHKRMVRKMAVRVKNMWCVLQPTTNNTQGGGVTMATKAA